MSQGYRNNAEAMRDNDGIFPPEYHDADDDDDTGADPDDTADSAAAVAGNRFVALGKQGSSRYGDADAAQPGFLERQCLHRSRGAHHESGYGVHGGASGEIDA